MECPFLQDKNMRDDIIKNKWVVLSRLESQRVLAVPSWWRGCAFLEGNKPPGRRRSWEPARVGSCSLFTEEPASLSGEHWAMEIQDQGRFYWFFFIVFTFVRQASGVDLYFKHLEYFKQAGDTVALKYFSEDHSGSLCGGRVLKRISQACYINSRIIRVWSREDFRN